jgi:hypothetical protein
VRVIRESSKIMFVFHYLDARIAEQDRWISEKDSRLNDKDQLVTELRLKYDQECFARAHFEKMLSVRFLIGKPV